MDGPQHRLIAAEGRLDGGFHILQKDHRCAHIRQQQRGVAAAHRAQSLLAQQIVRRRIRRRVQRGKQRPQTILLHGLRKQLRQQQLHGLAVLSEQSRHAQQPARCGIAHIVDPRGIAQQCQQLRYPALTEGDGAQQRVAAAQRHDSVMPLSDPRRRGSTHAQQLYLPQRRVLGGPLLKMQCSR